MIKPEKHIFVCTSSRIAGQQVGFCKNNGGLEIISNFLEEIEDRDLEGRYMVTNTGCLGICEKGPVVIIYPDNEWYFSVKPDDVEDIMDFITE